MKVAKTFAAIEKLNPRGTSDAKLSLSMQLNWENYHENGEKIEFRKLTLKWRQNKFNSPKKP
jgi:hypothetical protein